MIRFIIVFSLISLMVCGITTYLLKKRLGLSPVGNTRILVLNCVIGILIVAGPFLFRAAHASVDNPLQKILQITQYFLMGWVGVTMIFFLIAEFAQFFFTAFDPSKRIFLTEGVARGLVAGSTFAVAGGFLQAEWGPKINPVTIRLSTLPKSFDGITVAQISDVHIGPILHRDFLEKVVDQVMELKADLIFITGDLVDGTVEQIGHHMEALKRLKAKEGVYFCTGNHEYYCGAEAWITHLESIGIHVFKNTNLILTRGQDLLMLAGVYDWRATDVLPSHAMDAHAAAKTDSSVQCKILLSHNPLTIDAAAKAGFDLQISGHTHAGQFYPFAWIVKMILKHTEGLYQVTPQTQLYVNRGTGFWGPPNRLGKWSEITHFTLKTPVVTAPAT